MFEEGLANSLPSFANFLTLALTNNKSFLPVT